MLTKLASARLVSREFDEPDGVDIFLSMDDFWSSPDSPVVIYDEGQLESHEMERRGRGNADTYSLSASFNLENAEMNQ